MSYIYISIIIVSYNANQSITQTLESTANQTYSSTELIIIDGGSTDGTLQTIEKFSGNIDRLISEPDKGIYDAMNKGIKLAKGEWLLFMGADDLLYNNKTLALWANILNNKYHLIYGNVINTPQMVEYDGSFNLFKLIYKNICHQAIFFNRKVFEEMGYYDVNCKANADWDFNLKCFLTKKIKIKYIPQLVSYYNTEGMSAVTHDEAYEIKRKEHMKNMPIWVKICYKYRKTSAMKLFSRLFLNFNYA